MADNNVQSVLLMSVIILLIRDVCLLNCPSYPKHALLTQGLLYDEAICRAEKYDFEDKICLNGLKPSFFYCSTGSCNVFGFNCDQRCLAGYDNTPEGPDFSLKCTMTVMRERVKLCQYYNDRHKQLSAEAAFDEHVRKFSSYESNNFILGIINFINPRNIKDVEESIKRVCPRAQYDELMRNQSCRKTI